MKVGYQPPKAGVIRGVLVGTVQNGTVSDTVPIEIAADFSGAGAAQVKAAPRYAPLATSNLAASNKEPEHSLPVLMLLAILGGLTLNLMPCVFPVLSIKAINVMEQAKKHPAAVRTKGLVFAAGVISSMLCLAAVLLVLRAGGEKIGWGFQLQSPLFVTLMVYLLLAVGLNLSGVFEVGGGLAGVGDGLTQGDSHSAAFFTGVLTTLVATPCTAPYMAAAVGAVLTQPAINALCIFAALGLGLSLPYVLLSFAPWMRRALPKPGAWMDTLKQLFAFPIYASAAWLLWVLSHETIVLRSGGCSGGYGPCRAGRVGISEIQFEFRRRSDYGAGHRGGGSADRRDLAGTFCRRGRCCDCRIGAGQTGGGRVAALQRGAGRRAQRGRAPPVGQLYRELVPDLPRQRTQRVCRFCRARDLSRQEGDLDERGLDQSRPRHHAGLGCLWARRRAAVCGLQFAARLDRAVDPAADPHGKCRPKRIFRRTCSMTMWHALDAWP